MQLEVRTDNWRALALYRRFGYREFGRLIGYYEDGADALRLRKIIRSTGNDRLDLSHLAGAGASAPN